MTPRNIIKHSASENGNRSNLVKNSVFAAQSTARNILSDAHQKAIEIVSVATQESETLRNEAYAAGKAEAAEEFTEIVAAAYEKRESALHHVEQDVLKLSIKLAEKIIGSEIKSDKQAIANIVATAMRNVRQQERLIIRVNPQDFINIEGFKAKLSHSGRCEFLDFEPDPKISSGGCVIESEVGTVDARLETQLKILERTLMRQAEREATER